MPSTELRWDGLDDLKDFLKNLPAELGADAGGIVADAAALAYGEIRASYRRAKTGKLTRSLKLVVDKNLYGASAAVVNTAKHAGFWEFGTQARHVHAIPRGRAANWGRDRGQMAPARQFVPVAMKHRRAMYARLIALVERNGFTVVGGFTV